MVIIPHGCPGLALKTTCDNECDALQYKLKHNLISTPIMEKINKKWPSWLDIFYEFKIEFNY